MALDRATDLILQPFRARPRPEFAESANDHFDQLFLQLGRALSVLNEGVAQPTDVEPQNPKRGWIRYAVAPLDLGSGSDIFYFYDGSNWAPLATVSGAAGGGAATPVQDEGVQVVPAPTALNFTGAGVTASNDSGVATIDIPGAAASGDMLKSEYDTDDSGVVDAAEEILGVQGAGNDQYYGTDDTGVPGFHALPVVPSFSGALVNLTATQTGLTFPYFVDWDQALYDTDSFWNPSNPSRLTVPAGVSRVRVSANYSLELDNTPSGGIFASIRMNGASFDGTASTDIPAGTGDFTNNDGNLHTAVIEVSPGDYFELRINRNGLTDVDELRAVGATWFSIEAVG